MPGRLLQHTGSIPPSNTRLHRLIGPLPQRLQANPDAFILLGLFLIGAVIRLAFQFRAPAFFVGGDSQTYLLPAYELVRDGNWDLGIRRPPGYPLFLSGVIALLGEDTRAITFAQHILGLGTVAASYTLGRLAANRAVGAAVGFGAALSAPFLVYEHYVMSEALFTLLATVFGCVLLSLRDSGRLSLAILSGLILGLAWLTRPAALLLMPLVPLALLGRWTLQWSAILCGVTGLAVLVTVGPSTGKLVAQHGVTTAIGLGNNLVWRITRNEPSLIGPRDPWPAREGDESAAARRFAFSQAQKRELPDDVADAVQNRFGLDEVQADRVLAGMAMDVIRSRPALYLQTTGALALDLFLGDDQNLGGQGKEGGIDRYPNPQEKYQSWWNPKVRHIPQPPVAAEIAEFSRARVIIGWFQPVRIAPLLLVLCAIGIMAGTLTPRYRAALLLSAAVGLSIFGAAALSGSTPRFRYPFDPMIWTLAGVGVCGTLDLVRSLAVRARALASPSRAERSVAA